MPSIVLDTCILLDEYLGDRTFAPISRQLIDFCFSRGIPLLYSASSVVNIAYVLEQEFKSSEKDSAGYVDDDSAIAAKYSVFACLENLQEIATAVGVDDSDIWLARKYEKIHLDFEDNLVLAAVERSGADFLVTSDKKLLKHAPCATFDPKSMLEYLQIGLP